MTEIEVDIGSLCIHCGKETAFKAGNGLFVNRIPSWADGLVTLAGDEELTIDVTLVGYLCPECQEEEDHSAESHTD